MLIAFENLLHQPVLNNYVYDVVVALANQNPQHNFLLFTNAPVTAHYPANLTVQALYNGTLSNSVKKDDVQVATAVKAGKADLLISTNRFNRKTAVKQIVWVFALSEKPARKSWLSIKLPSPRDPGNLPKANIVVGTPAVFKVLQEKSITTKPGVLDVVAQPYFQPVDWQKREAIKEALTSGSEYILCSYGLNEADAILLLQAFSVFKRWQKTSMKLVLPGRENSVLEAKLQTYKYRSDVICSRNFNSNQYTEMLQGCYAFISTCDALFAVEALQAMQCGVPVIVTNASVAAAFEGAILFASLTSTAAMAEHLKKLFKDEVAREKLVAAGAALTNQHSFNLTISQLQQAIEEAVVK